MNRTRCTVAALAASIALAAPTAVAASAEAKPPSAGDVKSQVKQLLKDVAGKDKRLTRLAAAHSVTALADDTEAELVGNIEDAIEALDAVRVAVEAADSTVDTRAVRKELRAFRVENFRLAANVLKQAEALADDAAADPEALAFLDQAEAAALDIAATSTKAEIKEARTLLASARAELEAAPVV